MHVVQTRKRLGIDARERGGGHLCDDDSAADAAGRKEPGFDQPLHDELAA